MQYFIKQIKSFAQNSYLNSWNKLWVFHLIPKLPFPKKVILVSPLLTTEMFSQEEMKLNTYTWILGKMCFVLCCNKMNQQTSFFSSVNFKLSLKGLHPYLDWNKELFFTTCLLGKLKNSWILCKNIVGCTLGRVEGVFNCFILAGTKIQVCHSFKPFFSQLPQVFAGAAQLVSE